MDNNEIIKKGLHHTYLDFLKQYLSRKNLIIILLLGIFLNLLFLDLIILGSKNTKIIEKIISTPAPDQNMNDDSTCSNACKALINEATKNLTTVSPTTSFTATPTKAASTTQTTTSVTREYYVPFGSGSGSSTDWQNMSGLQASIDSKGYGNIKSVVFEVSLHIPTGNETVGVRLYNSTDNHPVWNSEVTFNGNSSSVSMSSNRIVLDSGNKLYKVQIKTQLQYPAVVDQSRVHIITN